MSAWFIRHLQTAVGALGRITSQRFDTLLTLMVIGIALALPACLQVLIVNARTASGELNRAVDLSVYLKVDTSITQAEQLVSRLRARHDIAEVKLIKAEDALKEFRERAGFGEALDALDSNPLPHALVVRPATNKTASADLDALAADLRTQPNVDVVQLDTAWVERFNALLDAIKRGVLVVAGLLGFGVLMIVGNTIRADIQIRQAEIEVTKLVGGSDAFVRRPFLYSGLWYGLGGGLIALLLSFAVVALLSGPIHRLAGLYGSDFVLLGLRFRDGLELLVAGMGLGWLGSWISASRHLRDIEPR